MSISGTLYQCRDPNGELREGGHRLPTETQRPPGQHCSPVTAFPL